MIEKNKIYTESCRVTLKGFPENRIDCVVTSPPYWGLRDYGNDPEIWGGDPDCAHEWGSKIIAPVTDSRRDTMEWETGGAPGGKVKGLKPIQGQFCEKCNAWRGCLGLEPNSELFVSNMVEIFRGIYRVLKPGGTVFLNLGDSYTVKSTGKSDEKHNGYHRRNSFRRDRAAVIPCKSKRLPRGAGRWGGGNVSAPYLKEKNLVGIPWWVALALQADGWYLRQEIIWHKTNAMPESVKDRCTRSHEHVFLLTKSPKYYFDWEAIAEPKAEATVSDFRENGNGKRRERDYPGTADNGGTNLGGPSGKRNKRSVWTFPTNGFPDAHFATFPEALPRTCILAGCPENGIVYDPFMGAGTTGLVARKLQRHFIGSEVNAEYAEMARKRIKPYLQQVNIYDLIEEAQ